MNMKKNYLLFVPSLMQPVKRDAIRYENHVADKPEGIAEAYEGLQTNEAVTKWILDYLEKTEGRLDKIIMLCTPEVKSTPFDYVQNRTTLQYYQDEIREYICRLREEKGEDPFFGSTDLSDLFQIIDLEEGGIHGSKGREKDRVMKDLDRLFPREETEKIRLFVDLTGGSRTAAMILIFYCRILQKQKCDIEKILYSNINFQGSKRIGRIEECTDVYNVFSDLEREVMIVNHLVYDDRNEDPIYGEINELRKNLLDALNLKLFDKEGAERCRDELREALEEAERPDNPYMVNQFLANNREFLKEIDEIIENPLKYVLFKLEKREYTDAFNYFREALFRILYEKLGLVELGSESVKGASRRAIVVQAENEVTAAYQYYRSYRSVLDGYVEELYKFRKQDKSPKDIWEEYIKRKGICLEEKPDPEKQNKFPYGCFFEDDLFPGYNEEYSVDIGAAIEVLLQLKRGEKNELFGDQTYRQAVESLHKKKYPAQLFPLHIHGISSTVMPEGMLENFVEQLAETFTTVRMLRNRIIHPKDVDPEDIRRAVEAMEAFIAEVDKIYQNKTCEEGMQS